MDSLVQQVLIVCPHISADDARKDLVYTKDSQVTINRIFDGNFLIGIPTNPPKGNGSLMPAHTAFHSPLRRSASSASAGVLPPESGPGGSESRVFPPSHDISPIGKRVLDTAEAPKTNHSDIRTTSPISVANCNDHDQSSDEDDDLPAIFSSRTLPGISQREPEMIPNHFEKSGGGQSLKSKGCAHTFSSNTTSQVNHIDISSSDSDPDESPNKITHPSKHKVCEIKMSSAVNLNSDSSSDEDDVIQLGLLQRIQAQRKKYKTSQSNSSQESSQTSSSKSSTKTSSARDRAIHEKVISAIMGREESNRTHHHTISGSDSESESIEMTEQSSSHYYTSSMPYTTETESLDSQTGLSQESGSSLSSGHRKTKRTPEEIQASKLKALERKAEKERQKQERLRLQESKKQQKQKQAQQKKTLQEAKRAEKPGECLKYMTVVLDNQVIEEPCGAQILAKLQTMGCKYVIEAQPIPACIRWRRTVVDTNLLGGDIELESMTNTKDEPEAIVILSPAEFVEMVYSYKRVQRGEYTTGSRNLSDYVRGLQRQLDGITPTMVVQGMEKYFKAKKNLHQREYRNAVLGSPPEASGRGKKRKRKPEDINLVVSRVDVEETLVDLQLKLTCNIRFVETSDQIADLVGMFTKAVAETPFKRKRDEAKFSFHVHVDWAGGVRVAKDGKGLLKVWKQQFQQFRNVSPEIASAIVAQYPSPQLLFRAYKDCPTEDSAKKLLQDIVVRRGEGVLTTSRRVGPELSRRVYQLFTSRNGELVL